MQKKLSITKAAMFAVPNAYLITNGIWCLAEANSYLRKGIEVFSKNPASPPLLEIKNQTIANALYNVLVPPVDAHGLTVKEVGVIFGIVGITAILLSASIIYETLTKSNDKNLLRAG